MPLSFKSGVLPCTFIFTMDNKEPRPTSPNLADIIKSAIHVKRHFLLWLKEFFGEGISPKDFEGLHESIKIGILYNYITKIGININTYKNYLRLYLI